jgi:predicted DCC family thiol-disulfide oxidoreductase YuxK
MLARLDAGRHFDFVSLHDPRAGELLPDRDHDDLMHEMHLVQADGRWYAGAESIRAIARRVPFLWGLAAYLHFPGTLPLWQRLYAAVARHRYHISARLGCDGDVCAAHAR